MSIADNSVPPIEAIIGHWFAAGEAHIVFAETDGRQFILVKGTLERCYGDYLAAGQNWGRRENSFPLLGGAREEEIKRAYHEAGHAVVCIDEGIKVEFVTIIPFTGWKGEDLLGFCQYDYRLPEALRTDCTHLAEKVAMADLGGPLADYKFRDRNGLEIPEHVRYAWRNDRREAGKRLADKAKRMGEMLNLDRELDRLLDTLTARFREPWVWDAITRIAGRLCDEGAIGGQTAKEIVEQAKEKGRTHDPH